MPGANQWVTDGTRLMTGASFIKALKIRGNLWHTGAGGSRGRPQETPMCDAGCNAGETLGHQVQSCTRSHDERVKRHDLVSNMDKGVIVLDTTIVADACITTMAAAYQQKIDYYDEEDIRAWLEVVGALTPLTYDLERWS